MIQDDSFLKRVLSTPIAQLLGKASYAFYLIYLGFIANFLITQNITGMWYFLALNVIAIALFKRVEEPLNHWLRRRGPGARERTNAEDDLPDPMAIQIRQAA